MTVPPSANDYYVVNLLDSFINSVGQHRHPDDAVDRAADLSHRRPDVAYAQRRFARIHGFRYRVMADRHEPQLDADPDPRRLARAAVRPRLDGVDPDERRRAVRHEHAARSSRRTRNRPTYFKPGQYTPTARQQETRAQAVAQHPARTRSRFFKQVGQSLKLNPLPTARTGLNGIPLETLPSWVAPQAGAKDVFRNPSFGQKRHAGALQADRPHGERVQGPERLGQTTARAPSQAGFEAGHDELTDKLSTAGAAKRTNYWSYLNADVGTYPNTHQGYIYRAIIVLAGGSANMPLDADLRPGQQPRRDDRHPAQRQQHLQADVQAAATPASRTCRSIGGLPPTVNDANGNPRGFWSIHVYQTDYVGVGRPVHHPAERAEHVVLDREPRRDRRRRRRPTPSRSSTGNPMGPAAREHTGPLRPDRGAVRPHAGHARTTSSTTRRRPTRTADVLVPGVDPVAAGPVVRTTYRVSGADPGRERRARCRSSSCRTPAATVNLQWGPIQPVSQLGSQQLTSGRLARNTDGSVTIWIAPTLPAGAPATNWIPTPSAAYYESIYGMPGRPSPCPRTSGR